MRKFAVIVAGGSGKRMKSALPKQFMLLRDKPVLYYTLQVFLEAFPDLQIILVLPLAFFDLGKEIIDGYFDFERITVVTGGDSRFHSVQAGLSLITEESIIFVHDGVRCLVTPQLIQRCYNQALETGSAVPTILARDSVRIETDEGNEPLDRSKVHLVQTPQTFHSKILLPAYQIDYKEKFTDEATVVEAFGLKVSLVEGEETNIKLTRPVDMVLAERILEERAVSV
jgi:2-C-methyl-D-erythritol 4-phosphate cytidylyltransferase